MVFDLGNHFYSAICSETRSMASLLTEASNKGRPLSSNAVTLSSASANDLSHLCGPLNSHLHQIEKHFQVRIHHRGNQFLLSGHTPAVEKVNRLLTKLYREIKKGQELTSHQIHLWTQLYHAKDDSLGKIGNMKSAPSNLDNRTLDNNIEKFTVIKTKKCSVKPRGTNQQHYVRAIDTHDINFGIGPAGTGKTYLAVACAVDALLKEKIERILLVRPAIEAGEKLGFLPGDLAQKIDPYLRPLYDALYEMLGFETVGKLIERHIIELAPLAYMRGRTLNNAFVILDESQNTTREQMKMFLTRVGFGSTAVINGDPTQVDLPKGQDSGLKHALKVLDGVEGVSLTRFLSKDVVRHPIVQRIVNAYEAFDAKINETETDR